MQALLLPRKSVQTAAPVPRVNLSMTSLQEMRSHKKLSTRANLHRIIPAKVDDDYCHLRKLPETEQHRLFTCIQKQDLWNAAFKKYLPNSKDPSCSSIFEDLCTLRLSKYYILHYHDKFTIYDFLLQSFDSFGKPTGNNSLNRLLSWMRLSSIKSRRSY